MGRDWGDQTLIEILAKEVSTRLVTRGHTMVHDVFVAGAANLSGDEGVDEAEEWCLGVLQGLSVTLGGESGR